MPTFILSDATKNSYGFKINMTKLRLKRFETNPVMLHNHNDLIGKWENIRLEDGKLKADPVFMDGDGEEASLKVKNRVEKGFLKGASIGINIIEVDYDEAGTPVAEVEILECSIVDVPSNANAVVLMDGEGKVLQGDALKLSLNKIKKEYKPKSKQMKLSADALAKLGLKSEATQEEVSAKILALSVENTTLKGKLEAEQKKKVETLIATALTAGKIDATNKADFEKLANTDYDLAVSTISVLPGKKTIAGKEKLSNTNSSADGRDEWTAQDWRRKDTAGLLSLKASDPEKYAEILKK